MLDRQLLRDLGFRPDTYYAMDTEEEYEVWYSDASMWVYFDKPEDEPLYGFNGNEETQKTFLRKFIRGMEEYFRDYARITYPTIEFYEEE